MNKRTTKCFAGLLSVLFFIASGLGLGARVDDKNCRETLPTIFERVSPAVVFISATSINPYRSTDRVEHIIGSGFIIDPEGLMLTNSHVAYGRQSLTVNLDDGTSQYKLPLLYPSRRQR